MIITFLLTEGTSGTSGGVFEKAVKGKHRESERVVRVGVYSGIKVIEAKDRESERVGEA